MYLFFLYKINLLVQLNKKILKISAKNIQIVEFKFKRTTTESIDI